MVEPFKKLQGSIDLSEAARSIWGKTDRQTGEQWSPLYVHMHDAGFVADRLWYQWLPEHTKRTITRNFNNDYDLARKVVIFLAAVHDIGKATPIFQNRSIHISGDVDGVKSMAWKPEQAGLPFSPYLEGVEPYHTIAGELILERYLTDTYGFTQRGARSYASVVGGHHGRPAETGKLRDAYKRNAEMGSSDAYSLWQEVQRELIAFAIQISGLTDADMQRLRTLELGSHVALIITGMVIMADWIASNSDAGMFPLFPARASAEKSAPSEFRELRERGERGWSTAKLTPAWQASALEDLDNAQAVQHWFQQRFNMPQQAQMRPMQKKVVELCNAVEQPGIMIVEAPMGEGKTEAALMAAEILAAKTQAGGVCVALPTMATTDPMFTRVHSWLDALPSDTDKSVWLSHGKATRNREFRGLIAQSKSMASVYDETAPRKSNTMVADWLWGRKKGPLANFLICTVDHVLMGALQMKHVALRDLALANKIVVVDECHAYDRYMQQYLECVLTWLGGLQVPVVLLSATLPPALREAYLDAYMRGRKAEHAWEYQMNHAQLRTGSIRGRKKRQHPPESMGGSETEETDSRIAYPLISYTDGMHIHHAAVAPSGRSQTVRFNAMGDDIEELCALLQDKLREGGCAAVVCDTVGRAQKVYEALQDQYAADEVMLLHARFTDDDRRSKEEQLLHMLGNAATLENGKRPHCLIVVGTQVLEQSLDIDVDLMISDIAPVDLIMQRVGRMHRHERSQRPPRVAIPECYVRGVTSWQTPTFDNGVSHVYEKASLMEALTVLDITDEQACSEQLLPEDIAVVVREAYGADACERIPEQWHASYEKAVQVRDEHDESKQKRATDYCLKQLDTMLASKETLVDFFGRAGLLDRQGEERGMQAVRDAQESLEVMLLVQDEDGVLHVLDEDGGLGPVVPADTIPNSRIVDAMLGQMIRLPLSLTHPKNDGDCIEAIIEDLERTGGHYAMAWQESPMLEGVLPLILQPAGGLDMYEGIVLGERLQYGSETGLKHIRNPQS
ncbi:CRISPR-associated helicase/endonuclease Cas3 [Bifidobacterium gallicum]|uniref:CRISPR-associated helicase Cas3 n=1 Tax=Bifidobacterium gallicum DSM 20093 = LMG 11596 TaxID=561180 RepID=D1NTH7_9BIFI|nr:CRISPR-associated helicase/endonuclease Cas3 [Bifidobacterium gallicum]EFA23031.1 CRISPR-associated helicase Cas3 [Bifidobacterium gallicum DSM 20093 = LMG 11596]KFI57661.1 CRISPR-associated helicase Cas3, core [Bifidobacterium gallicum DSM 20093 = LMG 11596]